ncbi:PREDICTED: uncharacterized protein LOC106804840 [Priapulus caudatus]|uniref:Uncharacterized protein LOC106804840 n=1 Tax=Priapulus caudatus TaxID=37621 RepID=A0ABM1DP11_PRICU|nr:PREDICTED: uncharacterized protein LOC106804840 [Priapulus caudatus]
MNTGGTLRRTSPMGNTEGESTLAGQPLRPEVKLCQQYMDMVWHSFTAQLLLRFQQHAWGGERADHDHLGHIALLPDAVTMVLIQMLRLISAKSQSECYPSLSLNSVSIVCRRLYQVSAQAQWDTVQCEALAACASDKCQPVPLENELYGTRTGKLLRDAYAPLLSVLMQARELVTHVPATNTLHSNAQRNQELKCRELLPLLLPSLSCVLATLTLATNWSRVKATQFLSSWSLGPFLLITQTDLKMLSDVNRRLFYLGQPNVHKLHSELDQLLLGSPPPGGACNAVVLQTIRSVDVVWQQLHDGASALQMLSSTLIRLFSAACKQRATEYFQAGMPTGKVWRRKGNSDIPVKQSGYIEQAVQELLQLHPVTQSGYIGRRVQELLQPVVDATSKAANGSTDHCSEHSCSRAVRGVDRLHTQGTRPLQVRTLVSVPLPLQLPNNA